MKNMNGVRVTLGEDKKTMFIPLPPEMWRPISGGCTCPHCKANPGITAYWDTLATATKKEFTWTVHYPELHKGIVWQEI